MRLKKSKILMMKASINLALIQRKFLNLFKLVMLEKLSTFSLTVT